MMIRKQISIDEGQQALLRRLARARGVSEAEVIRQAIDQQARAASQPIVQDSAAWEKARLFLEELRHRSPVEEQPRSWRREDAYDGRA